MIARCPAITENQMALRRAPDMKRHAIERHARAVAVGIDNYERRGFHLCTLHARPPRRLGGLHRMSAQFFHFARPQRLAMRAIAADLGARQQNLKTEMALDLFA